MPEWLKGTGCKPVGLRLRRFESCSSHLAPRPPYGAASAVLAGPVGLLADLDAGRVERLVVAGAVVRRDELRAGPGQVRLRRCRLRRRAAGDAVELVAR